VEQENSAAPGESSGKEVEGGAEAVNGRSDMSFSISQIGVSAESSTGVGKRNFEDDLLTHKRRTARLNPPRLFGFGHTTTSFHRYGYVVPPVSAEGGGGHSGMEPSEESVGWTQGCLR